MTFDPDDLYDAIQLARITPEWGRERRWSITRGDCLYFGEVMRFVVEAWPMCLPAEALTVTMAGLSGLTPTFSPWYERYEFGSRSHERIEIKGGTGRIIIGGGQPEPHTPLANLGIEVRANIAGMRFDPRRIMSEIHDELRFWISALEEKGWTPAHYAVVGYVKPRAGIHGREPLRLPVRFDCPPSILRDVPRPEPEIRS